MTTTDHINTYTGEKILSEGRSIRRRANLSTSVKGVWTWECTVDMTGYTNEELLEQLDALTVALEARCLLNNAGKDTPGSS